MRSKNNKTDETINKSYNEYSFKRYINFLHYKINEICKICSTYLHGNYNKKDKNCQMFNFRMHHLHN